MENFHNLFNMTFVARTKVEKTCSFTLKYKNLPTHFDFILVPLKSDPNELSDAPDLLVVKYCTLHPYKANGLPRLGLNEGQKTVYEKRFQTPTRD